MRLLRFSVPLVGLEVERWNAVAGDFRKPRAMLETTQVVEFEGG